MIVITTCSDMPPEMERVIMQAESDDEDSDSDREDYQDIRDNRNRRSPRKFTNNNSHLEDDSSEDEASLGSNNQVHDGTYASETMNNHFKKYAANAQLTFGPLRDKEVKAIQLLRNHVHLPI